MSFIEQIKGTIGQSGVAGVTAAGVTMLAFGKDQKAFIANEYWNASLVMGGLVAGGNLVGDSVAGVLKGIAPDYAMGIEKNASTIATLGGALVLMPNIVTKPVDAAKIAAVAYVSNMIADMIVKDSLADQ